MSPPEGPPANGTGPATSPGASEAGASEAGVSGAAAAGTPLVIVGAGGFARETAQAVRDVLAADRAAGRPERWRLLGHLDDNPALHGREVDGVPVLGGCGLARELPAAQLLVCVGSPADYTVRPRLVRRLDLPEQRYATLVHPTAAVSGSSSVGPGSVLLAHCVLTAGVRVGAHVAVMPHVVLTHDDVLADFTTVASGVRLGGGTRLARGAYIGSGALIREHTTIGAWSLIGMGSAVLGDVPPGEVWVGSPAHRLRAAGPEALRELHEFGEDGTRTTGARAGSDAPVPAFVPVPASVPVSVPANEHTGESADHAITSSPRPTTGMGTRLI